jgi:hypothetical protein
MIHLKATASANDIFGGRPVKIHRVQLVAGSTAAASLILYDAATAGTNDFAKRSVASAAEADMSWGSDAIAVGYLSATLSGAGAVFYIYYD